MIMALITCKECNKEYSDTLEACPHCGYKVADGVTVHGYTETFAVNPSVEVLKDGLLVSNVSRNDIVKIPTSEPCKLKFKCSFRSAECFARPGDHVLLAFNRITGSLDAKVTDDKNAQTEMEIVKGKGRSRTLWSFIICAALLALAIALNN
jgi:hypothetical protein